MLIVPAIVAQLSTLSAQTFVPTGRETLRGLPGVEVAVEDIPPELLFAGLTQATLLAEVQQRLRLAGITVYESQKANPSSAKPYVYVHLNALTLPGSQHAVAVQVHLRQTLLATTGTVAVVNAMTWDAHDVFGLAASQAPLLKAAILEMVDRFIADWRHVH
jgi:hypothetical protein